MSLEEALAGLELSPGHYDCEVNGYKVKIDIAEKAKPEPPGIPEEDIMLDPWVEFPDPPSVARIVCQLGLPLVPDVPYIPPDEEEHDL